MTSSDNAAPTPHKRRPRYSGRNPRHFEQKYKEHGHDRDTIAKVLASGKTPAGTHRPIMVEEILEIVKPAPGDVFIDCTLGHGGHAIEILQRIRPHGMLLGLDADPIEFARTGERLARLGFGSESTRLVRTNFASVAKTHAASGLPAANILIADLGVSSMQLDDPRRGFSIKLDGPLDMRMNPSKGEPASRLIERLSPTSLSTLLSENADEPRAAFIAESIAGRLFVSTQELASDLRRVLRGATKDEIDLTLRRVFQAVRIAVNDEFGALDGLLRQIPECTAPNARISILSFHSGEDRRVKSAFENGLRTGIYSSVCMSPIRPSATERNANLRSGPARMRWAIRSSGGVS